jgi:hypothetical protein
MSAAMKLPKRHKGLAVAAGATILEALFLRRRSGSWLGLRTIVRCQRGHLFSTTWLPGASVKALRLGPWRIQRCPVGSHWSLVRPVRASELTESERSEARAARDTVLP